MLLAVVIYSLDRCRGKKTYYIISKEEEEVMGFAFCDVVVDLPSSPRSKKELRL